MFLAKPDSTIDSQASLDGLVNDVGNVHCNCACKEEISDLKSIIIIDPTGDLLLQISASCQGENGPFGPNHYRVSSRILRSKSNYFDRLLDPNKFGEGATFGYQVTKLRKSYPDMGSVPPSKLPVVRIFDAGSFPKRTRNTKTLTLFFNVLHDLGGNWLNNNISIGDLTLLAIVGDRFDALQSLKSSTSRDAWFKIPRNVATKSYAVKRSEEDIWRQGLFAGMLLGPDEWIRDYSWHLIMNGSILWLDSDDISSRVEMKVKEEGLWWNLPHGLEEELAYRRECIISTIISIQDHFIRQYSNSKKRQCTRGYDSSPQCDSFQLGEMVRFFTRKGTLCLQSPFTDPDRSAPYNGSIMELIKSLKEFPSYQIDANHSHCGIRHSLSVLLEFLQAVMKLEKNVAVCSKCWQKNRMGHSWLERKGYLWEYKDRPKIPAVISKAEVVDKACVLNHDLYQEMFTARSRNWTMELE